MITVKKMERGTGAILLELDKEDPDPTNQHFHLIPDGTIEARMEQWNLATPEEALDLIITEAHPELPEIPDLLTAPDLSKARKQAAKAVASGKDNLTYGQGVTREMICSAACLCEEDAARVRAVVRDELATLRDRETITLNDSLAVHAKNFKTISDGYAELQEAREEADEADKRRGKN